MDYLKLFDAAGCLSLVNLFQRWHARARVSLQSCNNEMLLFYRNKTNATPFVSISAPEYIV